MNAPLNFVSIQGLGAVGADNMNTLVQWTTDVVTARGFIGLPGMVLVVEGRSAPNDGGQGFFYWNANSTAADDNGVSTIIPTGAGESGAWTRFGPTQFLPCVTILTPSGGDDGPAISALSGTGILACGPFQIDSNTSTNENVIVIPGTIINVATTKTLAFNGSFTAARTALFTNALSGEGTVTFGPAVVVGYPEWWGAQPNNPSFDCSSAINACVVACPVTELAQANYYTANPVAVGINGKTVRGPNWEQNPAASSAQIVQTSATATGVLCGTNQASEPSNIISNITLSNFTVYRSVTPDNPATGSLPTGFPIGVAFMWCSLFHCDEVLCLDQSIGFYLYGTVESYLDDTSSIRSVAGANPSNDNYAGYYLDYSAPFVGFNGGNASIYMSRTRGFAYFGNSLTYSACIATNDGCVDLFITQPESGFCQYGADLQCGSGTYTSEDFHLRSPIFDSCAISGIRINGGGNYTNITVEGGYINVTTANPIINGVNILGLLKVSGMQFFTSVASTGFQLNTCNNFQSYGNSMLDLQSMAKLTSVTSFSMEDNVVKKVAPVTIGPGVSLTTCSRGYIRPIINGPSGSYTYGVSVDSGSTHIEVNCSTMQPVAFGGAANKIEYNGAPWGGTTSFGTDNVASGDLT